MRVVSLLLAAWVSACAFPVRDGQFRCTDERCPAGFTCTDGLCRLEAEADAGTDAALADTPTIDAGIDAGDAEEDCAPSSTGPADEDLDGRLDEGCPYRRGPAHTLIEMHSTGYHFGPELSNGGTRLWFVSGSEGSLMVAERASVDARFGPPERVPVAGVGPQLSTVTEDGAEVFLQALQGSVIDVLHVVIEDGVATSLGPVLAGGEALSAELGQLIHPSISRDGLHLAVAAGEPPIIHVVDRANRDAPFGAPRMLVAGRFPVFAPDGGLFYSAPDESTHHIELNGTGDVATPALGQRPHYHPPTREVFFQLVGDLSASPMEGIARAEVCRTVAGCRAPVCPTGMTSAADGTHCFQLVDGMLAAPADACPEVLPTIDPEDRAQLATFHLVPERTAVIPLIASLRSAWIGLRRETPGGSTFRWTTGEPLSRLPDWASGEPGTPDCVAITSEGLTTRDCSATTPVLCELDRWPAWAPDGG